MYLDFYHLREFPFTITCNERFFFESAGHTEALANMIYTVQQRKGMVLVTGEVGAGKTFVGNMLGARLGPACHTMMVSNPPKSGKQLLRAVARELGVPIPKTQDKSDLLEIVEEQLLRLHHRGRLVALIIDEAQDLGKASLDEIRLLWNREHGGQRLCQIVLIGQPELRQRLLEPHWEPLRQRIVLSYHLRPLARQDLAPYIEHRLTVASSNGGPEVAFLSETIDDIFDATGGIPRLINVLCDNALLVGYARDTRQIDRAIVADVIRNMTIWDLRPPAPSPAASPEPSFDQE